MVEQSARELRLALPDDQRRAAGAAGVLHPAVRARIEKVGARKGARRDVALVERRSDRRLGRLSRVDRDHLELVAGGHRARRRPPSSPSSAWPRRCGDFCFRSGAISTRAVSAGIARAAPAAHGHPAHAARRRPRGRRAARHVGIDSMGAALGISARARSEPILEGVHTDLRRRSARLSFPIIAASSPGRFGRRITYAALCVGSIAVVPAALPGQRPSSTGSFCSRSFSPAASPRRSTDCSRCICLSSSRPSCARPARASAYNFGRILAAVGGLQTATLMGFFGGSFPMAGSVLTVFYLVGLVIIWLGPETARQAAA